MKNVNSLRNISLTILLILIIVSGMCVTGISAYLLSIDSADNELSVGNSEIVIKELFRNPDIEPEKITEITKKVTIENTGHNYSTVRVRVEFSSSDLDWAVIEYNDDGWTKDGDCWYYNTPLESGEETTPLFEKVTCYYPNSEEVADFDVYVYAESRNCSESDSLNKMKSIWQ